MAVSLKLMMDAFLASLPNCVNRDLLDKASTALMSSCTFPCCPVGVEPLSIVCLNTQVLCSAVIFWFNGLQAAIDFCMNMNTKSNRRKLTRALFTVHRTRYDLLPFYGRLVATLHPCMPDIATELVQMLKADFRWHVRKKDQINIESKLKTVRFIGENGSGIRISLKLVLGGRLRVPALNSGKVVLPGQQVLR